MKSILKIFELKLTARQIAKVDEEFEPFRGNYMCCFVPRSSKATTTAPGTLQVGILARPFGDKLNAQIIKERQRDEKRV